MPTIETEFTVECDKCGTTLEAEATTFRGNITITVEPCDKCIDNAYNEGKEEL